MLQVEGDEEVRVERAEDELEHALVAGADQLYPHRPEPVAEQADSGAELRHHPGPVACQLRGEAEAHRRLVGPAPELLLGREAIPGRVQLDGREPLRVEGEELLRVGSRRIEVGLPGRVRPAGSADMYPG